MPRPSRAQSSNFKAYLRHFRAKFTSNIQTLPEYWIDDLLQYKASGISTTDTVNVVIFDSKDTVALGTYFDNDELIYIPALTGDEITLGIGNSIYTLNFQSEGEPVYYNGTTYGLNDAIPISDTRVANVKGLGGLLIQGSTAPAYSVGVGTTSVSEGQSVAFTIDTTDVTDGTTLYFSTSGTTEASDFSDNSLTGSFNIIGTGATTGVATVTRTIATDLSTEGDETFQLVIRENSITGTAVTTSSVVTVSDSVASFTLTPSAQIVNEGTQITLTVGGNFVPDGTYYWSIEGTLGDLIPADFEPASLTGNVAVSNGTGSFSTTPARDRLTEGEERIIFHLHLGSSTGTIVASTSVVVVNDTSRNVGEKANGLTYGPIQVNRDNGDPNLVSDWYTICDLDSIPEGSSIAMFVDGSGSMTEANVEESINLLVSKLNARNITITTVTNTEEDWITPFLVDLP